MRNEKAFTRKMHELLEYSIVHGLPSQHSDVRFSDGLIMGFWWKKHKKEIYAMQGESLLAKKIVEVDTFWRLKYSGLSFEDKMREYLDYLRKFGKPQRKSLVRFSDYTLMGYWLSNNYKEVYALEGKNVLASEICYILKNGHVSGEKLSNREKMSLLLDYLQYNLKLPEYKNFSSFSNGELIRDFWNNYKYIIYDLKDSDDVAKNIINIVLENYEKDKNEVFEGRLLEILNYIENFGIPLQIGNETFKDGTKLGRFWYDNKQKIYELKDFNPIAFKIVNLVEKINPQYFDGIKVLIDEQREFGALAFGIDEMGREKVLVKK